MGAGLRLNIKMTLVYSFRSVNYTFRASHAERDANMKRQLAEDLKTRLKFLQEMEKSYRGQTEDLEKKVHQTQRNCFVFLSLKTFPSTKEFLLPSSLYCV